MKDLSFYHPAIAMCLVMAIGAAAQAQNTWHVDDDAGLGGDGSDFDNAFSDLQTALAFAEASPGTDLIKVAQGTYKPDPNLQTISFVLINGVTIEGGYRGCPTGNCNDNPLGEDPDDRDITMFQTILSGDLADDDGPSPFEDNEENSYHVVLAPVLTDDTAILDGFTVRAGNAAGGPKAQRRGGGIRCENAGNPTIRNCVVTANHAVERGGGMYLDGNAAPIVSKCTISANKADTHGGGVGMSRQARPIIVNCAISGNDSDMFGGGISRGASGGAGISATFSLTNCIIVGNTAVIDGGGLYFARTGGADIINCTIAGNEAASGGGYFHLDQGNAESRILNSVVWDNVGSTEGPQIWIGNGVTLRVDFSDVEGGEVAAFVEPQGTLIWLNNIGEGPMDDPLFTSAATGNYRLSDGSPCIDAADDANLAVAADPADLNDDGDFFQPTPLDLDLTDRERDDPNTDDCPQAPGECGIAPIVDMGPYEFRPCPEDVNGDCVVNVLDLIDVLLCFGLPAVPDCEGEDVNEDGTVNVLDLIDLLLVFGMTCSCGDPGLQSQSLEEELTEAGLTEYDWDDFMYIMENGTQEEKDNWHCWMAHYLSCHDPPFGTCNPPPPNCPGSDPFGGHTH